MSDKVDVGTAVTRQEALDAISGQFLSAAVSLSAIGDHISDSHEEYRKSLQSALRSLDTIRGTISNELWHLYDKRK